MFIKLNDLQCTAQWAHAFYKCVNLKDKKYSFLKSETALNLSNFFLLLSDYQDKRIVEDIVIIAAPGGSV